MTHDEDDDGAALVGTIRSKLVEYKRKVLGQLIDQRVALLDDAVEKETSSTVMPEDGEEMKKSERGDDEVAMMDVEDEVSVVEADAIETSIENGYAHTASEAREDEDVEVHGTNEEERAMTEDVPMVEESVKEKVLTPTITEAPVLSGSEMHTVMPVRSTEPPSGLPALPQKRIHSVSGIEEVIHAPPRVRVVQRMSMPPRRYLEQKERDDEAAAAAATRDEGVQLVLHRSPSKELSTKGSISGGASLKRRSQSVDEIDALFDQKLRVTMRLNREVDRRSTAMTRKRQLPRLPTPVRRDKSHWDYLLEEMRWMAMDFSQERNWKRVMQYHIAHEVVVAQNAEKVRREQENRQRARDLASQVSAFWRTIERIAARSRVRFESSSTGQQDNRVDDGVVDDVATDKSTMDDVRRAASGYGSPSRLDDPAAGSNGDDSSTTLKFKRIQVEPSPEGNDEDREQRWNDVKARLQRIVQVGKKARSLVQGSAEAHAELYPQREDAIQRTVRRGTSSSMLAAFQILALRWMLDLFFGGCNLLLNDQLGMAKAATIAAFLHVVDLLQPSAIVHEDGMSRPHLVIVPSEEMHKWAFYLREWNQDRGTVQIYTGTTSHRKHLQREWSKKRNVRAFLSSDLVEEFEKEDAVPVACCVCPLSLFLEDQDAFLAFQHWQTVVVEKNDALDAMFSQTSCVEVLQRIQQQQRRILCCGDPVESWPSSKVRNEYVKFLLGNECGDDEAQAAAWTREVLLEKSSALEMARWFAKTGASSSLLKSHPDQISASTLALCCLTLRRVRSDVEAQLGKIDEQSVACTMTTSQKTQYRNAVTSFITSSALGSDRQQPIEMWLQLFLRLRSICNCVDVLNDAEKLALADTAFLFSSSGKLQALGELITRLVEKEARRVVIYCQLDAMFPILEMLLALMNVTFVRVVGTTQSSKLRALCHFSLKPAVKVALVSTRVASHNGNRAVAVYGADAIIVLDSDWSATCDAKLRATWARLAVARESDLPVYRFHCDETIEGALLQVGACLNEKVFGEMSPHELVALQGADGATVASKLEKPSWWSANGPYSTPTALGEEMARVEDQEKYCGDDDSQKTDGGPSGDDDQKSTPLQVVNVELDAEEHLLLANADELMPVEWYAVNYIHNLTEKKRHEMHESTIEGGVVDDVFSSSGSGRQSFDHVARVESQRQWKDAAAVEGMFYSADQVLVSTPSLPAISDTIHKQPQHLTLNEALLHQVLNHLRTTGCEIHFDVMTPPEPPTGIDSIVSEPGMTGANQMLFRVAYREPAPPPPPPPVVKPRSDSLQMGSETPVKQKLKKHRDKSGLAIGGAGRAGTVNGVGSGGAMGSTTGGVKRKLDTSGGSATSKPFKEQRVDFDGIPLPDVNEFADDDFWGDTNLDALDSASWDDASVLSGILGTSMDSSPAAPSSNSAGSSGAAGMTKKKNKGGGAGAGAGGSSGTGRARKGSISDSGKEGWTAQDDLVLKKLFELYGSNWSLIAHVFNAATSVSRFVFRRRLPRQCYDRYGKIISGTATNTGTANSTSTPMGTPTKDSKASALKQQKLTAAAAATWTPDVLAERVGIPQNESLLSFSMRNSLPGLPPASSTNEPTLAELILKKTKQRQLQSVSGDPATASLDDLKPIRTSFDSIIQCMKRKVPPPPIPIPQPATSAAPAATATEGETDSTTSSASVASSPTKPAVGGVLTTPTITVVPPPHKSHHDLVELFPRVPLAPEDVIKRSKEAAAVAVQAAAAVASVGREVSPLSTAGDVMMGATFGSAAVAARKAQNASIAAARAAAAASAAAGMQTHGNKAAVTGTSTGSTWGDTPSQPGRAPLGIPGAVLTTAGAAAAMNTGGAGSTTVPAPATVLGMGSGGGSAPPGATGLAVGAGRNAVPVSTSTLLHVLDRMPEIKNKIQAILNRNDCSEAQKVAMIARLLSNTNAISATAVAAAATGSIGTAVSATMGSGVGGTLSGGGAPTGSFVGIPPANVAQSADTISAQRSLDTHTPIPMPDELMPLTINSTPTTTGTSAASAMGGLTPTIMDTDMDMM